MKRDSEKKHAKYGAYHRHRQHERKVLSAFQRVTFWGSFVCIGLLVLCGLALVIVASLPTPHLDIDMDVRSLRQKYHFPTIHRDEFGVPHIFGQTEADGAFGVAFAHAEDDFTAIQKSLLAARGLCGLVSSSAIEKDLFMQVFNYKELVTTQYTKQLSADVRDMLVGYADGVNAYAALHPREVLHSALLPVTAEHLVLAFLHKQGLMLGLDGLIAELESSSVGQDLRSFAPGESSAKVYGGNAYAVQGVDGYDTVLAGNPHMPWASGPLALWEAHVSINSSGNSVYGGFWPATPFPVFGHNNHLGWSFTLNRPDVTDVFKLSPTNKPGTYRLNENSTMTVSVTKRVYNAPYTLVGPIVWTSPLSLAWAEEIGCPVAKSATRGVLYAVCLAGSERIAQLEQLYRMGSARNFEAWKSAIDAQQIPLFNLVYADNLQIFYQYSALIPDRKCYGVPEKRQSVVPLHPIEAKVGPDVWMVKRLGALTLGRSKAYIPLEQLPNSRNPSVRFLFNTNNSPFRFLNPDDYSPWVVWAIREHLEDSTYTPNRAIRLHHLLTRVMSCTGNISYEDVKAAKFDTMYDPGSEMGRVHLELLKFYNDSILSSEERKRLITDDFNETLTSLFRWNLNASVENRDAALIIPVLSPFIRHFPLHKSLGNFWRYQNLSESERLDVLASIHYTLLKHIKKLQKSWGTLNITWGEFQKVGRDKYREPLDGGPDLLRSAISRRFDRHHVGIAGDTLTLFIQFHGNGSISTEAVHQWGSSSDRDSRHFFDQAKLFSSHGVRRAYFYPADVAAHTVRKYQPLEHITSHELEL